MIIFGATAYGAVAAFFVVVLALLLPSLNRKPVGLMFVLGCVVTMIWAAVLAAQVLAPSLVPAAGIFVFESARAGAWTLFLLVFLRSMGYRSRLWIVANVAWIAMAAVSLNAWLDPAVVSNIAVAPRLVIPLGLASAIVGVMLIEQIFRNSRPPDRWKINALCLSVGGIFAYDVFLYAQAMLFGAIDEVVWMARGAVNALAVPFLAIAARRNSEWDLSIFVSRQVVFYSSTLVAVGAYLLLVSLGGYLLNSFGGEIGQALRIAFLALSALVLVSLLLSEAIRGRLKVFIAKHFYRNRYDYREEWLKLIGRLADSETESSADVVLPSLGGILESPSGVLWSLDSETNRFVVASTWHAKAPVESISVDDPVVRFLASRAWIVDLDELDRSPQRYGQLSRPAWLNSPAVWLIVPLMFRGELCAIALLDAGSNRRTLNFEDRDLLKTVANHLAVHVVQEKADQQLVEAEQFAAFNRLTAFLMHDLKNIASQLSMVVQNSKKHKHNPEFVDDAFNTLESAVDRMQRVIRRLRKDRGNSGPREHELRFLLSSAVDRCADRRPVPMLDMTDGTATVRVPEEDTIMTLVHLIHNAQEATPSDGTVKVCSSASDTDITIRIEDTGCGMSADFVRHGLFKPFASTKGAENMGIGAFQARQFARSHGGDLVVESTENVGTVVSLTLPRVA